MKDPVTRDNHNFAAAIVIHIGRHRRAYMTLSNRLSTRNFCKLRWQKARVSARSAPAVWLRPGFAVWFRARRPVKSCRNFAPPQSWIDASGPALQFGRRRSAYSKQGSYSGIKTLRFRLMSLPDKSSTNGSNSPIAMRLAAEASVADTKRMIRG